MVTPEKLERFREWLTSPDPRKRDHARFRLGLLGGDDATGEGIRKSSGNIELPRPRKLSREIVVARYREDLSWLNSAEDWVTVYNKGETRPSLEVPHSLVTLPNWGREAGTWLSHIVLHFDDLAEQTSFVQGGGLEHQPDLLERINASYPGPVCLATQYLPSIPPRWIKDQDLIEEVSGFEVRYGNARINGQGTGLGRPWFNPGAWSYVFRVPIPVDIWFCYSAQWAVPRWAILSRPRRFYEWLLEALRAAGDSGDTYTSPPVNAWALEALWRYIWDPSFEVKGPPGPQAVVKRIKAIKACPDFIPPGEGCGCQFGKCMRSEKPTSFWECDECLPG